MAVAERRLVSVLFADLVGFTTRSEDRDPEETRELLSRYFEVARRIVEGHGGTVEKFIGDAVMAVWGAPTAHEDDAERAVRSALAIVAGVGSIADGDVPLHARAAVLTGEAAVTVGAEGQGMVAGDMVNTASRLQSVAQPGTVLVGEATYRATSNAISYEPAGERVLKGKTAPVPAWRAVAVVARRGGSGRASTLEPPFVGREDELQQLKDLFDATGRERKPRLVTVIGQAGIGKSRLAWEFEKYLDGVVETAYWHEGRTPAYGEGISYWALAEMVRLRAQITEGEDAASARPKLTAMLEQFVDDPEERRFVEPRLAGLLGLAELPSDGREELFAAWRTLFERIAAQAPTVLVFVDLHWADQGLLDFVEDLLAWARTSPIFVVALARPELLERRPDWGSAVRSVTRINLEPLAAPEMAQLLDGLVPGLPEQAVTRIVERSEGIPAVRGRDRAHAARHRLGRAGGRPLRAPRRPVGAGGGRDAPCPDRRAAGRQLTGGPIAHPGRGGAGSQLHTGGAGRCQRARGRPARRTARPPDPSSAADARQRPTLAGAWAASVRAGAPAGGGLPVAGQAGPAHAPPGRSPLLREPGRGRAGGRAGQPLPGCLPDVACRTGGRCGGGTGTHRHACRGRSRDLTALAPAGDQLPGAGPDRHARRRRSKPPSMSESSSPASTPARWRCWPTMAARRWTLYREAGDEAGRLRAATAMARDLIGFHLEDEAAATLDPAIEEAKPLGKVPELAGAYAELGRALMLRERHAEAIAAADEALSMGAIASPLTVVEALITKGTSMGTIGRTVESEAILRGAIRQADDLGLIAAGLRARNNLSGPLGFQNEEEAGRLIRDGYEIANRYGHRPFVYQFLFALLEANLRLGNWDDGIADLDAIEGNETPYPFYQIAFLGARAIRAALRGDLVVAEQLAQQAQDRLVDVQSVQTEAYLQLVWTHVRFAAARWDEAIQHGRQAGANSNFTVDAWWVTANAAAAADDRPVLADALDAFLSPMTFPGPSRDALHSAASAAQAAREGRWDDVHGGFAPAIARLAGMGSLTYAHMAGLLWDALAGSRDPDAAEAGRRAAAFFEERGASSFVERYRAAFVPVSVAAAASDGDSVPAATAGESSA